MSFSGATSFRSWTKDRTEGAPSRSNSVAAQTRPVMARTFWQLNIRIPSECRVDPARICRTSNSHVDEFTVEIFGGNFREGRGENTCWRDIAFEQARNTCSGQMTFLSLIQPEPECSGTHRQQFGTPEKRDRDRCPRPLMLILSDEGD